MRYVTPYRIVGPVSRGDPQLAVEDIGRHHFLIAPLPILALDKIHQGVINVCSFGQEEAAARTQLVEEKQILVTSQLAMVSLGRFLLEMLPLLELFGVREGHAIDTL